MRRAVRIWGAILAGGLLVAGCGGQPPYENLGNPVTEATLPGAEPVSAEPLDAEGASDVVTAAGPGGLVERLPNTCRLENYQRFVGQEALAASFQVTDRPVRIVAPDAIVSQVYDPQRVNFYTDGSGRVARLSCG